MCYNCGCQIANDDMGKGNLTGGGGSLTDDDFKIMAEKWGMSVKEAKKNVYELLKTLFMNSRSRIPLVSWFLKKPVLFLGIYREFSRLIPRSARDSPFPP